VPDLGASRAADLLAERFGIEVPPTVLLELDWRGLVPRVGWYQEHRLADGHARQRFTHRAALEVPLVRGRLLTADAVAEYLRVRHSDVDHLTRSR
jgi:hypothetical protein